MSKDKLTPLKIIEGAFDYFLDGHPVSSHAGEGVIQRLEEAGFVIVPKEMTPEMIAEAKVFGMFEEEARKFWVRALAARP